MRRTLTAVAVAASGMFAFFAGQALFRQSPDEIWAACAVVGMLSAVAIAFESSISKAIARARRA